MGYIEWLAVIAALLFILYRWLVAKYDVLHQRGVPHEKPFPCIGNMEFSVILGKSSIVRSTIDQYRKFESSKVYGSYSMRDPVFIVRDLECIKKILIKDFDIFPNHKTADNDMSHDIMAKSLLLLQDRKWKEMRQTLSPSFTGSKLRLMFELVNECCIEGVTYMESELKASGKAELELEMKDYFTRFTNDAIASTAFGIKVNSFTNKTNEFYTIGKSFTQFQFSTLLKIMLIIIVPKIMKALRISMLDEKKSNYFRHLVFDAMKIRQENNIVRPDMIQLLMEAKRHFDESKQSDTDGAHAEFNDDDLLAQCLIFFVAGFDTVATCLCFTAHELLANPVVQDRLYEEIVETEKKLAGKPLQYETVMNMQYMDMVLSESLRKWPPAIATDRMCAADYKLTDSDGNFVVEVKKGEMVMIPTIAIHHDPNYFPNPEEFDPERFSAERKEQIKPMSYMPFGVGPRSCIGNRLALMEAKTLLYHMLLKFRVLSAAKTSTDLMNSMRGVQLLPKELFWMKFVPRTN